MSKTQLSRACLALGSAVLLLGSACHLTPRGSQNTYSGSEGSMEIERVEGNSDLAARLKIVNPRTRRASDGRLQVQFDLQNTRSSQTDFAWTVDWFDASGFLVKTAHRAFEPMSLGGGAARTISITAPTPESASWRLSITARDEIQ